MARIKLKLKDLFNRIFSAVNDQRENINALDSFNGNHGDNMVQNIGIIRDAIVESGDSTPSVALLNASRVLGKAGKGGTSQYYAEGLKQAAELLVGHDSLEAEDAMTLVETLMGAIPVQGYPAQGENVPSVLQMVAALSGNGGGEGVYAEGMGQLGDMFELFGGMTGGGELSDLFGSSEASTGIMDLLGAVLEGEGQVEVDAPGGFELGGLLQNILPKGLDLLLSGEESSGALERLNLIRSLLKSRPDQAHSSREGAAAVIGKSVLEYLLKSM
jgi:hypothetical protein